MGNWPILLNMKNLQATTFFLLLICFGDFGFSACTTSRKAFSKKLHKMVENNNVFNQSFTGFALYDPQKNSYLYQKNANKYFTPASNTKLFTFFTSLKILGDSLPSFTYSVQENEVFVWGLGDPTTLHPAFSYQDTLIQMLKSLKADINLCNAHFSSERYGPGWAWDDYPYYYQAEKSVLPIYGNSVWFQYDSLTHQIRYYPNHLPVTYFPSDQLNVLRIESENQFLVDVPSESHWHVSFGIPFTQNDLAVEKIISSEVGNPVKVVKQCPETLPKTLVHSTPVDTVYRYFLQTSDNMIAEQLLLNASAIQLNRMDSKMIIDYAKEEWLDVLPDEPLWYDGSGLSRYNMFTPRSMVALLQLIYDELPEERLLSLFPAGGISGTTKNWYKGTEPYVFAKTGTLRNKHCLSGYIKTNGGKTLIFSFMHNNYRGSSTPLKQEMEKILSFIKENY